jgi:hypothetical protein
MVIVVQLSVLGFCCLGLTGAGLCATAPLRVGLSSFFRLLSSVFLPRFARPVVKGGRIEDRRSKVEGRWHSARLEWLEGFGFGRLAAG